MNRRPPSLELVRGGPHLIGGKDRIVRARDQQHRNLAAGPLEPRKVGLAVECRRMGRDGCEVVGLHPPMYRPNTPPAECPKR